MDNSLEIARNTLLLPTDLTEQKLQSLLGKIIGNNIDNADLYFQASHYETWVLEDQIVKEGQHSISRGVGVRAMSGEKTGFAYSDDLVLPALEQAVKAARSITQQSGAGMVQIKQPVATQHLYSAKDPLVSLSEQEKVALLQRVDQKARQIDPRVKQVMVSLSGVYEIILLVASDGSFTADVRPLVRLNVSVIAEQQGRRESGNSGGGGRLDYQYFLSDDLADRYAEEAVRQAILNLDAISAPAGTMPVVLGPGWPGVLLHEAVGHGLEGDFNRKKSSAFSGRIGQRVAAAGCTVVDDGTLANRRGSLNVDDEGTKTQRTVLIEDGILRGYMMDKMNARLMNMPATGNGRRESYAHLPMPRMTNTYLLAGAYTPDEIIATVDKGLYVANLAGGQVDITSGKFVFSTSEAYLIEKGKITQPVKGATLIGNGPDVLLRASMLGNDLRLDDGVGTCGKEGQSVPVGVGQPTVKIDALTVGGTG